MCCLSVIWKTSVHHSREIRQSRAIPAMVGQEAWEGEYWPGLRSSLSPLYFSSDHRTVARCFYIMSDSVVFFSLNYRQHELS